ncbi:hypothetical protein EV183_002608 [Coemansia sp. RSA 2336]|nr:hypothetical protein EV183_002608 [Coemansia sp. RSA 2336]
MAQFDSKSQEGLQDIFNTMSENGRLLGANLLAAIRANGPALTNAEIEKAVSKEGQAQGVDYAGFVQIMGLLQSNNKNDKASVDEAFKVFDKDDDGLIQGSELRHILTSLGEKLQQEEVDEMFKEAGITDNEMMDYAKFTELLFRQQ